MDLDEKLRIEYLSRLFEQIANVNELRILQIMDCSILNLSTDQQKIQLPNN